MSEIGIDRRFTHNSVSWRRSESFVLFYIGIITFWLHCNTVDWSYVKRRKNTRFVINMGPTARDLWIIDIRRKCAQLLVEYHSVFQTVCCFSNISRHINVPWDIVCCAVGIYPIWTFPTVLNRMKDRIKVWFLRFLVFEIWSFLYSILSIFDEFSP